MLGGYEWARWEHFWLMIGYILFFVVHVIQVIRAGWNNFRSMIAGYEIQTTPVAQTEPAAADQVPAEAKP